MTPSTAEILTARTESEMLKQIIFELQSENEMLKRIIADQQIEIAKLTQQKKSPIYFIDAYAKWLEQHRLNVQESTFYEYERIFERDIKPYFAPLGLLLSEVTPEHIEFFYRFKSAKGLNNNSIIRIHANLHTMFKYYTKHEVIDRNPFDKVTRPKPDESFKHNYYDADQILELLKLTTHRKIFVPIIIATMLGLRRSEVLGLKWDAINFNLGTITIRRKVTRNKRKRKDEISAKLKTKASYRTLVLPAFLHEYLLAAKKLCSERAQLPYYNKNYMDYICVDKNGNLLTLNSVTNGFAHIIQDTGMPKIRYHDLRHSCATMLYHLGYSLKDIQEWLGHSTMFITAKLYTHVNIKDKKRIAGTLDTVFQDLLPKAS